MNMQRLFYYICQQIKESKKSLFKRNVYLRKGVKFMKNVPKNASERAFQENFVNELKKYKWYNFTQFFNLVNVGFADIRSVFPNLLHVFRSNPVLD